MSVDLISVASVLDRRAASVLRSRNAPQVPEGLSEHPVEMPGAAGRSGRPASSAGFEEQLRSACLERLARIDRADLCVLLNIVVDGPCPDSLRASVLRAAAEMTGNAVLHGFYQRRQGQIDVWFIAHGISELRLEVSDNGWGFDLATVLDGRGFRLLRSLGDLSRRSQAQSAGCQMTTVSLSIRSDCENS